MADNSLQQARAQLQELIEFARKGMIVPVRLPGQLEAIDLLLQAAEAAQATSTNNADGASSGAKSTSGDVEAILKENTQFLSHAVHDLRNPLTSIRGYADMLNSPSMGELNDMQKQFLATIRTNTSRVEGLLTDVSDINKIRGGTLVLKEKMDIFKNIVMMIEKQTAPIAQQLNRKLVFDIPQGLPPLTTDGELLAKAVIKLIENALRYTPEENGQVTVRGAAEGSNLIITVEDNGIGMTPEELSRLGEVYYRVDNEVNQQHKGSGLGIPIAYGLIAALGGTIQVESEPGKGTRFIIKMKGMS